MEINGPGAVPIGPAFRAGKPDQNPAFLQPGSIDDFAGGVVLDACARRAGKVSWRAEAVIVHMREEVDFIGGAVKESCRTQFRLDESKGSALPLTIEGVRARSWNRLGRFGCWLAIKCSASRIWLALFAAASEN